MYFYNPYAFILLIFLFPIYIFYFRPIYFRISSIYFLKKNIGSNYLRFLSYIDLILFTLSFILMVLALARPQLYSKESKKVTEGIDIVLAVDASGSMAALDFDIDSKTVDRLEAVKHVIKEFILSRPDDRIGMVVFGSEAYTQIPLTLDHNVFNLFLDRVEIGIAGDSTSIGDALGVSINRLKDLDSKSKIVILLTDGMSNSGNLDPMEAASVAAKLGIKVYTIGIGQNGPVPIPQDTIWGRRIVQAELPVDEELLKKIADVTDAKFFKASDTDTLKEIYDLIDKLEKSRLEIQDNKKYEDIFSMFLLLSLCFLITFKLFDLTRFKKVF